jgi:hypothetical protein
MVPYSPDSKVINAVRSPLGMGALIVLALTIVMVGLLPTGLSNEVKEVALVIWVTGIAMVGFWTLVMPLRIRANLPMGRRNTSKRAVWHAREHWPNWGARRNEPRQEDSRPQL